ncbi:FKBP-type peptidyl-prolyl cis-trans isomerase [Thalassolituus sp.]|jgi:peptidylprolyl isomerase|uniref:FKBP-type peptidyl-prolyl cis-trans isomerase n=1 Tax=Thalassolituus sp. TaxID=2030822 RepID=UPI002603D521|nr:FKBP-type peptidyl-prolyl cis-trans isomerase [uncultured Thalassolituus sp.]TNC88199.1 MAG: peptidylprolyl isomerase [Thalassolituus sp.]
MFNIILVALIVVLVIYALKRAGVGSKGAEANIAEGRAFLETNRDREEVTETSTGLQYEIITEGTGDKHPAASSRVTVHYHGTLLNGSVFDSSVQRNEPIAFGLNQVIPGWTEGVQLMTEGAKYRFWIPADLGYGNRKVGTIPAGSVLVFEVELLGIA